MSDAKLLRYWDVAEATNGRPTNLGKTSTAKVMKAILLTGARLCDYHVDGGQYAMDSFCPVSYRVAVPVGQEDTFEELSGCRLDSPGRVAGQSI